MDAQLADLQRVLVPQVHDLILPEEHIPVLHPFPHGLVAHAVEGNIIHVPVVEGPLGRQGAHLLHVLVEKADGPVFLRVVEGDGSAFQRLQAGDRLQQFPLAAAGDAGNAQNLPAVGGKADILQHMDSFAVIQVQALDHQAGHRVHRVGAVDIQVNLLAHHHLGQLSLAGLRGFHGGDMLPLAQDSHPVADLHDLVQLVGNDDNALSVFPHAAQDGKQAGDLLGGQHRGGFIQDQDVRAAVQHLDNLHRLLL